MKSIPKDIEAAVQIVHTKEESNLQTKKKGDQQNNTTFNRGKNTNQDTRLRTPGGNHGSKSALTSTSGTATIPHHGYHRRRAFSLQNEG